MSAYFPLAGSNAVLGPTPADGSADPTNALNIAGNAAFAGNISAGNMGMFRNRVINGDMRVDQRNAGNAGNSGFGPDRFKVVGSNCATSVLPRRIELGAEDVAATGGAFQYATSLSAIAGPTAGLTTYLSFNSNIADVMGGLANPTVTGTVRYVPGVMANGTTNAIYLANEGNVLTTATRSANILAFPYIQSTALTVSCWVQFSKLPQTTNTWSCVWTFGSASLHSLSLYANYVNSTTASLTLNYYFVAATTAINITSNTWYHVACTYIPSTSYTLYLNGSVVASVTSSVPSAFSPNSQLTLGELGTTNPSLYPFAGYIDDFRIYNRALGSGEIALLAGLTTGISSAPSSGLAAYYPFDGSVAETSGNSGPTLTTTGSVSYVTGAIGGQAVYLANEGNVLTTPTKAANRLSGTYTISGATTASFWVQYTKLPQSGGLSAVFSFGTAAAEHWVVQTTYSSATTATLAVGAGSGTTSIVVTIGVWYNITAVWVPLSTVSFYVNGTHISTVASSTATLSSGILQLGDHSITGIIRPFAGYIDDFRIYNRALTSAEIAYLAGNAPYPSIQTFNQAAHFPFDGALTDASGNGVTLTPTGTMQYVTGVTGTQALYLANEANVTAGTASANYIRNTTLSLSAMVTFSVSMWIYSTRFGSTSMVFFDTNSGTASLTNSVDFYINTGYKLSSGFNGTVSTAGATTLSINVWYNVVLTYNNGMIIIYLNGAREATVSGTIASSTGFTLGTAYTTATIPFAGYIDDFRIYNTALTQSQITALYYGSSHIANQATPYLGYVPSAAVLYQQSIEGNNVADLFYGTANAAPVAVSLWLKNATASEQSFTLALNNGGAGGSSRSALYPIASVAANTWRRVAVKVPGDLIGTWLKDNSLGLNIALVLGANSAMLTGTAGAWQTGEYYTTDSSQTYSASATGFLALQGNAVYITGVQLEKGALVTPFEFRPLPVELGLCQRYYEIITYDSSNYAIMSGALNTFTNCWTAIYFKQNKRIIGAVFQVISGTWINTTPTPIGVCIDKATFGSGTGYFYLAGIPGNTAASFSAEL